jgi:ankyrin repeat protein
MTILTAEELHTQIKQGRSNAIAEFLSSGGDPNTRDQFGQTLLITAIMEHNLEIVEILKSHGARVDIADNLGLTPHHYAILSANEGVIALLSEQADQ